MFSSGYDLGDLAGEVAAEEAERLVAHPFTAALDALEACEFPTVAALPGHTSAAASSSRSRATCASPPTGSAGHAARQARPRLLPHGLRRFLDAIGRRARASSSSPRATSTRGTALTGARQPGRRRLATSRARRSTSPRTSPPTRR
jgi:hypothetical protein